MSRRWNDQVKWHSTTATQKTKARRKKRKYLSAVDDYVHELLIKFLHALDVLGLQQGAALSGSCVFVLLALCDPKVKALLGWPSLVDVVLLLQRRRAVGYPLFLGTILCDKDSKKSRGKAQADKDRCNDEFPRVDGDGHAHGNEDILHHCGWMLLTSVSVRRFFRTERRNLVAIGWILIVHVDHLVVARC